MESDERLIIAVRRLLSGRPNGRAKIQVTARPGQIVTLNGDRGASA
jgi:hypothetical protein